MAWQNILGHDQVVEQFRRAIGRGRMASSFLFVGSEGIGKRMFAVRFAQALLCETAAESDLDPCGHCPACQQVVARTHPDLILIEKPKDKSFIPVETFIGDREHRMREGLCHDIAMKAFRGRRKIAVIDDADFLNQEGANCLLKTLEEPPAGSVLILIGTSEHKQLPTIRSRCQTVRFNALPLETMSEVLLASGVVEDTTQAQSLAQLSGGSMAQAIRFADADAIEVRERLLSFFAAGNIHRAEFVKYLTAYVDEAGKEAALRRERMNEVVDLAVGFYRQLIRSIIDPTVKLDDAALQRSVEVAMKNGRMDEEVASDCLTRCLETRGHISANANQATLLECWIDEICQA